MKEYPNFLNDLDQSILLKVFGDDKEEIEEQNWWHDNEMRKFFNMLEPHEHLFFQILRAEFVMASNAYFKALGEAGENMDDYNKAADYHHKVIRKFKVFQK